MGRNFFLKIETEAETESLHIGKSSYGWAFALHVIPEKGLTSLRAWRNFIMGENKRIENEEGEEIGKRELLRIITECHKWIPADKKVVGLARARLGVGGCIGHGKGSWDLIEGEFS